MHKARSLANVYYWNKYYKKNNIDKITEDLEEDYFTSNSSNG